MPDTGGERPSSRPQASASPEQQHHRHQHHFTGSRAVHTRDVSSGSGVATLAHVALSTATASPDADTPESGSQDEYNNGGSFGNAPPTRPADSHGAQAQAEADALAERKIRACEGCRSLKVRCEPPPLDRPNEPCKRCKKAGRRCVIRPPTKKREKKNESRISELEKKINSLTQHLSTAYAQGAAAGVGSPVPSSAGGGAAAAAAAGGGGGGVGDDGSTTTTGGRGSALPASLFRDSPGLAAVVQQLANSPGTGADFLAAAAAAVASGEGSGGGRGSTGDDGDFAPPLVMAGLKRKLADMRDSRDRDDDTRRAAPTPPGQHSRRPASTTTPGGRSGSADNNQYYDVVDRGILSMAQAEQFFRRYTEQMVQHLPAVVFGPEMTASSLREAKPLLFLAIMAAASSEHARLQRALVKELMQVFADRIVVSGDKSMEIVQALQVAVIWYWPPEHFEELKFYQLVHMAGVMALDIGLGRRGTGRGGAGGIGLLQSRSAAATPYGWRNSPLRRQPPVDPSTCEARRAWLACFFLASNTAMALHRPNLIRWAPFMEESLQVLRTSADAAPTDTYFCHLVWVHKLSEDIGAQFNMDDAGVSVDLAEPRTQFVLRALEAEMQTFRESIPPALRQPTLLLSFDVVSLYMHEIALHDHRGDEAVKHPYTPDMLRNGLAEHVPRLTAAHVSALAACLAAIDGAFSVFLSMDVESVRCLPVFNFVRIAYAVVVLIKMYLSSRRPGSELGALMARSEGKVEEYLDGLLDKFRQTAAEDKSRPAAKFMIVLIMLKTWLSKQKRAEAAQQGGGAGAGAGAGDGNGVSASGAPTPGFGAGRAGTPSSAAAAAVTNNNTATPPAVPFPTPSVAAHRFRASTPLQVLSHVAEAAASTSDGRPGTSAPSDAWPPVATTANTAPVFGYMYDGIDAAQSLSNQASTPAAAAAAAAAAAEGVPGLMPTAPTTMGPGGPGGVETALPWANLNFMDDISSLQGLSFEGMYMGDLAGLELDPSLMDPGADMISVVNAAGQQWLSSAVDGSVTGGSIFPW